MSHFFVVVAWIAGLAAGAVLESGLADTGATLIIMLVLGR